MGKGAAGRILTRLLAVVMAVGLLMGGVLECVYAYDSTDITLDIPTQHDIDVVLSVGDTEQNTDSFEADLTTALTGLGIPESRINIQAIETSVTSSNSADANAIFNGWTRYNDATDDWALKETETPAPPPVIMKTTNSQWSGFYDPNFNSSDYTLELEMGYATSDNDDLGITFGMKDFTTGLNESQNGYTYVFCGGETTSWPSGSVSIKNNSHATGLYEVNGTYLYPLVGNASDTRKAGSWYKFKLVVKDDNAKIYKAPSLTDGGYGNYVLIVDYTTGDGSNIDGTWGFFANSQPNAAFRNITMITSATKLFSEVIREPDWRDTALRFVVNADDTDVEGLDDGDGDLPEILARMDNEQLHYIGWGSTANQAQANSFITKIDGRGTFVNGQTSTGAESISAIAQYIYDQYAAENAMDSTYLTLGTPFEFTVTPESELTGTADGDWPDGKWRVVHDGDYYENGTGTAAYSGQYLADMDVSLDKPGKYDIYYKDGLIKTVYVHRAPISNFTVSVDGSYNVTLTDNSYDIDNQSAADKGIADAVWKWKNVVDSDWTTGQPSAFSAGQNYIIQLTVQDDQGESSIPYSRYISTEAESAATTPIAEFTISPSIMYTYNGTTLTVNDTSYDPGGESIPTKTWTVNYAASGTQLYTGSTPKTDFSGVAAGEYTITLVVQNASGIDSEPFSRTLTIVEDTEDPTVTASSESGSIVIADTVTLTYSDTGGSDLDYQKYALMPPETEPGAEDWSASSNNNTRNVIFNQSGTWYLYYEAADNAGNTLSGHFGPYTVTDVTPPTDPSITMTKTSDDSTYVSDTWIGGADSVAVTLSGSTDDSGFVYYQYSTDDGDTWTDSSTVTISDGGTTTLQYRARDKSNNYSDTATVVIKIDKTAPTFTANIGLQSGDETTVVTASITDAADGQTALAASNPYSITLSSDDPAWASETETTFTTTPNTQVSVTYRVADIAGNTGTQTKSLYTQAMIPDVSTLTANPTGSVSLKVEEHDNPDATSYYVQKAMQPDFSDAVMAADWTNPGADHLITITGLDRSTTYYFRVKARNNESTPVETEYGSMTGSILTIPEDAEAPAATAVSSSRINLAWSAVTGAASYDVYYSENGTDYTLLKNVTGTATSDVGLSPNTGRQYRIVAKNSSGSSSGYSAASSMAYTYAVMPGLTLQAQPDGSIDVTIDANGNTAGTEYYIEYGADPELTTSSNTDWFTGTTKNITGLDEGTSYYFRVKARNGSAVETTFSDIAGTKTTLSPPTITSVDTSVDGTTFKNTVTWSAVEGAINYKIYRDGVYVGITAGTTYEDAGVKANTLYEYTVTTVNTGGEGAQSASDSCRTLAAYPAAVTATAKTGDSITLTITPSANVGDNQKYKLTLKDGDTTVKAFSWSSNVTYVIVGLDGDTEYAVWVDAANSDDLARGEVHMLDTGCNHAVSASLSDNADAVRSEAAGFNDDFVLSLKVWDPDADNVTVTASINGLTRTVTAAVPATQPDSANVTLSWDVYSLSEGSYSNIDVSVSDGYDSNTSVTYTGTLTVDKTPPVVTITGDETIYAEVGDVYTDAGATVTGDDGNGLTTNGTVDTSSARTYTMTYSASDDAGNTASATRTVYVVEPVSETTITVTVPPEGIGSTSAALTGTVTTLGKALLLSDYGYIYSTEPITEATNKQSLGPKTDLSDYAAMLTGLTPGTMYYVRPYVTADGTTFLGAEKTFTTLAATDETQWLYISPVSVDKTEADGDVTFTIARIGDTTEELNVTVGFAGTATSATDYTVTGLTGSVLTIPADNQTAAFTVSVTDDGAYEGAETVVMTLGPVDGYTIADGNGTATLTISDNDTMTPSSECDITAFALAGKTAAITGTDITLTVPTGTALADIAPDTLTVSDGAAVTPSAAAVRDFTSPVAYTVTAQDGTTKRYVVTVTLRDLSTDSTLSSLTVKDSDGHGLTISPPFYADTTEYSLSVGSDIGALDILAAANDAGADVTYLVNGTADTTPDSIALDYGSNTIEIIVTAEDGTATTYTLTVSRAAPPPNANADLINITILNGTLEPDFDTGETNYNVNVPNATTTQAVTPTLSNEAASYVIRVNGTTIAAGEEAALNVGANVFTITVTATDGTQKTYAISVSRAEPAAAVGGGGMPSGGNDGGSDNGSDDGNDDGSGSSLVPVLVNGETVNAGTQTTGTTPDGKDSTTVVVDSALLDEQLGQAGSGAIVTVPISGGEQVKSGVLTGQMISNMEQESAMLQVDTGAVTYILPADEFDIDKVAEAFGGAPLEDIVITISVDSSSATGAEFIADEDEFTVVMPPVDFTITAEYNGESIEVSTFSTYVQRMVEIPTDVSPDKVTTALVVDEDGTVRHVPTEVVEIDGKYYAVINSLTNSTYALVQHPIEFSDVIGHWAKDAINNLGSRMVVTGVGGNNYAPDADMTRAEFAAIVVRALGLSPADGDSGFDDVFVTDWYCGYVKTAVAYDIITGYGDGTFRPKDNITREQAMTMLARAMVITGLDTDFTVDEIGDIFASYADSLDASDYAVEGIAACLSEGISNGRTESTIAPEAYITRAEVAVMVERLLQKSNLI